MAGVGGSCGSADARVATIWDRIVVVVLVVVTAVGNRQADKAGRQARQPGRQGRLSRTGWLAGKSADAVEWSL